MISNYFTLLHTAHELAARTRGARVREAYTQEKRRLCLTLESPAVPLQTLVLSCVPSENYALLLPGSNRARANAADLFPALLGREIVSVRGDGADRRLAIELGDGSRLLCEFFGVRANLFVFSREGTLEDCFLHKAEVMEAMTAQQQYPTLAPVPLPEEAVSITGSLEAFTRAFRESARTSALAALKAAAPKLGAVLSEEMLFRAEVGPMTEPALVPSENLQRLYDSSLQSVRDLLDYTTQRSRARIYWEERRVVCFSLLELRSQHAQREECFDDLFEALRRAISGVKAHDAFGGAKEAVTVWIGRETARAERTLSKMREDAEHGPRAALYEMYGTLVMANLGRIEKGARAVVLEDFTREGTRHTIALDPALSAAANAARYFERAKHAKASAREAVERRALLEARARTLRALSEALGAVATRDELKQFHAQSGTTLKQLGYMTETEQEQLPPFRIFTVDGGFQVLAGKSSENNDLLTTKYAKPNDLWFHARGSSGSHVVLKMGSAAGEPSKKAVHQAASIAAYYSKMKNASAVPVAMTEKKFVHKPRGVPAGTVTLDREKVIFVEPKLPESAPHI